MLATWLHSFLPWHSLIDRIKMASLLGNAREVCHILICKLHRMLLAIDSYPTYDLLPDTGEGIKKIDVILVYLQRVHGVRIG